MPKKLLSDEEQKAVEEATLELLKRIKETAKGNWPSSIVQWATAYKILKETKEK